jgi:hypothetical protein
MDRGLACYGLGQYTATAKKNIPASAINRTTAMQVAASACSHLAVARTLLTFIFRMRCFSFSKIVYRFILPPLPLFNSKIVRHYTLQFKSQGYGDVISG